MTEDPYNRLEDVVRDPLFPDADLALRAGRHIDQQDLELYGFMLAAMGYLEEFYQAFGCELVHRTDGYFFLLPTGSKIRKGVLTTGEMLVGQVLALLYLDPTIVSSGGQVEQAHLLETLGSLVGEEELVRVLVGKRSKKGGQHVREAVDRALKGLSRLGFVEREDVTRLKIRSPILRFADPVKGLSDPVEAMQRLVAHGEVAMEAAEEEED